MKPPNLRRKILPVLGTDAATESIKDRRDEHGNHRTRWEIQLDESRGRHDQEPLTVTPVETIGQADELMSTNKIRQLPVVQAEGSGRHRYRSGYPLLSSVDHCWKVRRHERKALNTKISDIMTTEPITLSPEDDLEEAVELLIEEKIGGIPVVAGPRDWWVL